MRTNNQGYILIFTIMIIAIVMALVTKVFERNAIHYSLTNTIIQREKAKELALSGIQLALSRLSEPLQQEEQKQEKQKKLSPEESARNTFQMLFPILNQWQTISIDIPPNNYGKIRLCFMAEEGKINLNSLYDFKKGQFITQPNGAFDGKALIKELFETVTATKEVDLFAEFLTLLKDRTTPFEDPTELLTSKLFATYFANALFYEPPETNSQQSRPFYLTDLFTVWSPEPTLEPWLLSDSIRGLFGLTRTSFDDTIKNKERMPELLNQFTHSTQWNTQWNKTLASIYNKDFNSLPKYVQSILTTKFEPKLFSVLCYGEVGSVVQKLLVIIERTQAPENSNTTFNVAIKRVYWL